MDEDADGLQGMQMLGVEANVGVVEPDRGESDSDDSESLSYWEGVVRVEAIEAEDENNRRRFMTENFLREEEADV